MPLIAITLLPYVKEKIRLVWLSFRSSLPRRRLFKADLHRIENVVAAMKCLWTFVRRIEQVTQGRDRSIVQIWRAYPDTVQWRRHIPLRILRFPHGGTIDAHLLPAPIFFGRC